VVAGGEASAHRAGRLAETTPSLQVEVVAAASRRDGLVRTAADWVVFLDDEDEPDDDFLEALVAAQAASGADVVTTAVRPSAEDVPGEGLAVLSAFEKLRGRELRDLPELAATLAATLERSTTARPVAQNQTVQQRLGRRISFLVRARRTS